MVFRRWLRWRIPKQKHPTSAPADDLPVQDQVDQVRAMLDAFAVAEQPWESPAIEAPDCDDDTPTAPTKQ